MAAVLLMVAVATSLRSESISKRSDDSNRLNFEGGLNFKAKKIEENLSSFLIYVGKWHSYVECACSLNF